MSNQYIKNLVRNERTQANLTGMSVDTQSRFLLNPMNTQLVATSKPNANIPEFKNIFLEKIEEFATWAENLKINNEKSKLKIALQKMDLDLEEKWKPRESTDKYRSAYEEYTKDRMKIYNEKQKLIHENSYLTLEEKQKSFSNLKMSLNTDNYIQNGKRSEMYLADTEADTLENIRQRGEITASFGLDKDSEAQANYKEILNDYKELGKLIGEHPKTTLRKAVNEITKIEITRLHKDIQNKLENPKISLKDKKEELEKLVKHFENPQIHEDLAKEFVDKIGIDADDKEQSLNFIKASFSDRSKTLTKSFYANVRRMEKEERAYNALITEKNRISEEFENVNFSQLQRLYKKQTGKILTNEGIVNGSINIDWSSLGDLDEINVVDIFDKKEMKNLKTLVEKQTIINGGDIVSAHLLIMEKIDELLANETNQQTKELKKTAFIKQYAQGSEYEAKAIYFADTYPELLEVSKSQKMNLKNEILNNLTPKQYGFFGGGLGTEQYNYTKFKRAANELSPIQSSGEKMLKKLLYNEMIKDGYNADNYDDVKDEYFKKLATGDYDEKINALKELNRRNVTRNTSQKETKIITKSKYGIE